MKLYSELAEHYFNIEKATRSISSEIKFLHNIFQKNHTKKILDLGCGTGEHVQLLNAFGYNVSGIDAAASMIEVAKKRYSKHKFEIFNMKDYKVDNKLDAIICLFGAFDYLLKNESIEETLFQIESNLKPSGLAILEIWNAEPLAKIKSTPLTTVAKIKSQDELIERKRGFRFFTSHESFNMVEINYMYQMKTRQLRDQHYLRVYYISEIFKFLKKFQLEILDVYGNYDGLKFYANSGKLILLLKRKNI